MKNLFQRLHSRMGDLWWYTILVFVVQRFSDVINFFVGLWLVPKYVPQNELGAVLPLTQFASFIGIPLAIVSIPFMKFLNVYAEKGEMGKVKAMLRDVFIGTGVMAVLSWIIALILLPFIFERMRVATGSLGILIVGVAIFGAASHIFQCAVQGLKLFSTTVWFFVLSAPFRLVAMIVTMPFRALSGYFVGQAAGPCVCVLGALWSLRRKLGASVKAENYWREDGCAILRYTWPIALATVMTACFASIDQLVIRHRLSDFDSAGYYIISRFAEIATYLGTAFVAFLFPLVASRPEKDAESRKILMHSVCGTLFGGVIVAVLLFVGGKSLLSLNSQWRPYQSLTFEMFLLAIYNTFLVMCNCFSTYEMAQGRFKYLLYTLPLFSVKAFVLYTVTGYNFFEGMLPDRWLNAVADFNPNRLICILIYFVIFQLIYLLCLICDVKHRSISSSCD